MKKLILSLILSSYFFVCNAQSPTITSFSPASGAVGTLVTITGTNLTSPTSFTIGGVNAIVVSNSGAQLVGMVMPGATNGMATVATAGGTVSRGYFTVTPTSYPKTQQGNKLLGIGATGTSNQGAVSVSSDGNTAIVGGPSDNNKIGAVWIYIRSGGGWIQQGNKLVGAGSLGKSQQGWSVSLSADGNTAIVGAPGDSSSKGPNTGAVWTYTRSGGVWMQQGNKLVGKGAIDGLQTGVLPTGAQQGRSVSLSADGNTAIVGGNGDSSQKGAAWIYTRSGGIWTQQGNKLIGMGAVGAAQQGVSVSLSSDGNTACVGGPVDQNGAGAIWVYTRSGGVWTQQGSKLLGIGAFHGAQQGVSVSLSSDGNTAIVGGSGDNNYKGAVWIYIRSGGVWTQQGNKLVGTGDGPFQVFQGGSVSLSADGNTAIVGGSSDNYGMGAVWIYTRSGGIWTQQGGKLVGSGATTIASQGCSVSISSDGNTAIVGGGADSNNTGATWIYSASNTTGISTVEEKQNHLTIYPNPNNGMCTVQSDEEGVYVVLYPLGQTVHTFRLNAANSYTQTIENMDSGIYIIVGDGYNGRSGKRMVVAK
jgi:hypothetical protein